MTDELDFNLVPEIRSSVERLEGERENRLTLARDRIKTGVPFLDKALGGMRRNDLLLVGGSSGGGKTELVSQIAKTNVEAGRRVHFFALEAEEREIERRILYKLLAQAFYRDAGRDKRLFISYRDWLFGALDDLVVHYETEAQRIFSEKFRGLHTIYRTGEFSVTEFERYLLAIKDETDLVIVDHLNYFDFDERINENVAVTQIVKKIRDLALITGVPIVLVAHIRKRDKRAAGILPELEDFMGSSNVYKIATQCVLIAAADSTHNPDPKRWPTYIRVAKNRVDGSLTRYMARIEFNSEKNEYEPTYTLGRYKPGMEAFEPIQNLDELPHWARR
jgi:replicative DNA helicase